MLRHPARIICDAARRTPASFQAGDYHEVAAHHRYYGSSASNGGERIVDPSHSPRPSLLRVLGL
jgi:hypothetical protein